MKRRLMVGASIDFAAAKTCWRQGPLAWVAPALSVAQVVALVPHQHASGSPCEMHGPVMVVPGWLLATRQAYKVSHSTPSAGSVNQSQPSVPSTPGLQFFGLSASP